MKNITVENTNPEANNPFFKPSMTKPLLNNENTIHLKEELNEGTKMKFDIRNFILGLPTSVKVLGIIAILILFVGLNFLVISTYIWRIGQEAVNKEQEDYKLLETNITPYTIAPAYLYADFLLARDRQNPINGELFTQTDLNKFINTRPVSIMVENHPEARPQFGLSSADVVHEALAEGGITRYVATYWSILPEKVGPERSARTYFVDMINEYDGIYAHNGWASAVANFKYDRINPSSIDIPTYFSTNATRSTECGSYRDQVLLNAGKAYEHTLFTSPQLILDCVPSNYKNDKPNITPYQFKSDSKLEIRPLASEVDIQFLSSSNEDFRTRWVYNKDTNTYKRFLAGNPDIDANTQTQIQVKNLVVQYADFVETGDPKSHVFYQMLGEGNADIFIDGKKFSAKWKKVDRNSRTEYFDTDGNVFSFNRGKFWIAVVPMNGNNILGSVEFK